MFFRKSKNKKDKLTTPEISENISVLEEPKPLNPSRISFLSKAMKQFYINLASNSSKERILKELPKFYDHKHCQELEKALSSVENSLQNNPARAILYHLVLALKPENVLEIGTYKTGTAYLLGAALNEIGQGHLITIDPFAEDNQSPQLISNFPKPIKDRISQQTISSALFFDKMTHNPILFDYIFIDGNHEFEFAYFDLQCAARFMKPGGIIILDNIDQVGPRQATQKFLQENPLWTDINGEVLAPISENENPISYFEPSFPGTIFYIIKAPPLLSINKSPHTTGNIGVQLGKEVKGFKLTIKEPAKGKLFVLAYFRSFGDYPDPQEVTFNSSYEIEMSDNSPQEQEFKLIQPEPYFETASKCVVEITIAFYSEGEKNELTLVNDPQVISE